VKLKFETNGSGSFQEANWYTSHIYWTVPFGCHTSPYLGRKQTW